MRSQTILRLSAPAPRYTSYPTAPHFHAAVDAKTYAGWLGALSTDAKISLYLHIPFCDRLCWFCGCHTKQTQRYDPVKAYLDALHAEIQTVSRHLSGRGIVTAIHFGGGSPTMMSQSDMVRVRSWLDDAFNIAGDAEISIEIDPNDMTEDRYAGLAALGLTRASLGVQDFDKKVQTAINRLQGFDETRAVVERVRALGARSVNLDILYGLPFQTQVSIAATARQVLLMKPDRIALFGYAHVPWMKKHQRMIDEVALPDSEERYHQAQVASSVLEDAGYIPIGIDHFALPQDSLAVALREGRLRRNFQGYTVDGADALIGLGASAIGRLPQGHVQNMPATGAYQRLVNAGSLAVVRGLEMSEEDRLRGSVIESLMCEFGFSRAQLCLRFGDAAQALFREADILVAQGEFLARVGERYEIKPEMRLFARQVAARFDAYLGKGQARHSAAV
ncbi:MAG: oxygen-independent coproporphyrinogen III oxidase [Rhizobiaceae bacterium]